MKAVDFSFIILFVNCGFAIIASTGAFGSEITEKTSVYQALTVLSTPIFSINSDTGDTLFSVTGVMALAGLIAVSTVVILQSNLVNDRGVAVGAFAALFYGSLFLTGVTLFSSFAFPGLELFYTIFVLICTLSFVLTIIQMPTGGQKSFE